MPSNEPKAPDLSGSRCRRPGSMAAKTTPGTKIVAVVGSDESEVKRVAREHAGPLDARGGQRIRHQTLSTGVADNSEQAVARIDQTIEALLTFPFSEGKSWCG